MLALVLGLALVGDPSLSIDIVGVLGGVLLTYFGAGELLSAAGVPPEHERPSLRRYRALLAGTAVSLGVLIGGVAIALGVSGPSVSRTPAAEALSTCDGYAQLCSRRLDQVVLAGTHNAMSAADSPGWFIANQQHAIARQLDDGLRAFKISTHYGEGKPGNVRTDIQAEGARANRVSEKLSKKRAPRCSASAAPSASARARASAKCGCATRCASSARPTPSASFRRSAISCS